MLGSGPQTLLVARLPSALRGHPKGASGGALPMRSHPWYRHILWAVQRLDPAQRPADPSQEAVQTAQPVITP